MDGLTMYRNSCDLPVPGSPTISRWDSPRTYYHKTYESTVQWGGTTDDG
jgi:hypothetical protein